MYLYTNTHTWNTSNHSNAYTYYHKCKYSKSYKYSYIHKIIRIHFLSASHFLPPLTHRQRHTHRKTHIKHTFTHMYTYVRISYKPTTETSEGHVWTYLHAVLFTSHEYSWGSMDSAFNRPSLALRTALRFSPLFLPRGSQENLGIHTKFQNVLAWKSQLIQNKTFTECIKERLLGIDVSYRQRRFCELIGKKLDEKFCIYNLMIL